VETNRMVGTAHQIEAGFDGQCPPYNDEMQLMNQTKTGIKPYTTTSKRSLALYVRAVYPDYIGAQWLLREPRRLAGVESGATHTKGLILQESKLFHPCP
jgi:hypothetical protein